MKVAFLASDGAKEISDSGGKRSKTLLTAKNKSVNTVVHLGPNRDRYVLRQGIDKITYRTQTPYTFFGHNAFTAISYPGEGAKSQPTG
jgi:hypothetical protein